jgi:Caspase domain
VAPKREQLSDGVERWYFPVPENGESYLTRKFEEMYNIVVPKSTQPFDKSIAFLAGVSKYQNLAPQLPSVHNDIIEMRDLLLNSAGFDEVYVAENDVVSRDLIEQYIKGTIARKMGKNDRLLFYYSGHGGDNQGKTGYMLFGRARRGEFWGPQVLAIDALSDWSRELQVQHILFIVDSCASGLAFTAKLGPDTTDKLLLQTLSGNGSRTVLTAGTADEATYAMEDRRHLGNGVFTRSLIDAFQARRMSGMALITISDLFSSVEKYMARFRATEGKATTPRMWPLQEGDYRGTFVFLNTKAGAAHLTGEQARGHGGEFKRLLSTVDSEAIQHSR